MDKDLWKRSITEHHCPPWPCPNCGAGVLVLEDGSLKSVATKASLKDQDEDWWDADYVVYSFTAWAKCSNATCAEEYALSGDGGVEIQPDENWNTDYVDTFRLRHCHPTLPIISLPKNCPDAIREALGSAFTQFWQDRPSSAGRIRVAIERLLDHLGMPDKTASGGYVPLDNRLDMFMKIDEVHGSQLMALKWLGNVGSHTVDVNVDDLLAAFEVLEHALMELVEKKSDAVAKLAANLTNKYGKK